MRTLIAGVGYSHLTDLSVGPIVVEQLRRESWPSHVEIDDLSYGPIAVLHRLKETLPPYDRIVFVASVDREAPAARLRWYRWDGALPGEDEIQARVGEAVTGVIDLDNLMIVTGYFDALPADVAVIEVQPVVQTFGLETSPAVAALLPEVRRLARELAAAPAPLRGATS